MVRPRKEGLDYFPLNVHFDEKIKALELLHKNDGLVWIIKFWQNAYLTNSGEVNLSGIFGVIQAENCRITTQKQADIVRDCLELQLITKISDDIYTSNGVQKRLNEIVKDREIDRKRRLSVSYPLENQPETGESKVKKRKENIKTVFRKPSMEEVRDYCIQINSSIDPEVFFHTYESSGWIKANGQKVQNWKSTIRTWEKRNTAEVKKGGAHGQLL